MATLIHTIFQHLYMTEKPTSEQSTQPSVIQYFKVIRYPLK